MALTSGTDCLRCWRSSSRQSFSRMDCRKCGAEELAARERVCQPRDGSFDPSAPRTCLSHSESAALVVFHRRVRRQKAQRGSFEQ